jgi:hypothetical protein
MRGICGVAAVMAAVIGLTAASTHAARATTPAAGVIPDAGIWVDGDGADLQLVKRAGVRWIAIGARWRYLEPEPGSYKVSGGAGGQVWADLESETSRAKALGLHVLLVLTGAPSWATGSLNGNVPPRPGSVSDYASFLSDLATALGPTVDAFAPWNEPNHPFFWNPPDPAAYVKLQQAAYRAIKLADPTALVLSAPIAPTGPGVGKLPGSGAIGPYEFLEAAYRAGLKGSFDVLAWNAYPPNAPEDKLPDGQGRPYPGTLAAQPYLHELLDRLDPGRKVWITEFGWSTCSGCEENNINGTDAAAQASYLARSFLYRRRYLAGFVERVFWFQLRDGQDARSWGQSHGLVHLDGTPKPSYLALSRLARGLAVPPAQRRAQFPARATGSGTSVSIDAPIVRARDGTLRLTAHVDLVGGASRLRVEGYQIDHWVSVAQAGLPGTARVRLNIPDRGYLMLRVTTLLPGTAAWAAQRVVPIP